MSRNKICIGLISKTHIIIGRLLLLSNLLHILFRSFAVFANICQFAYPPTFLDAGTSHTAPIRAQQTNTLFAPLPIQQPCHNSCACSLNTIGPEKSVHTTSGFSWTRNYANNNGVLHLKSYCARHVTRKITPTE